MKFVDKLTFNNNTYEIRDSAARDILTQQGENIAEIDGRQQVMRSEINSLQTRMGEAEQDILNNSASIADIEDAIDVMDNDIDSNTGRITALEARVDECEDINTAQQVEINNIKNRVTTAEGNINVINGNISDINTSLDAIAAVDSQQTAQINQNKADITTLKNRANAADSRMDAMDNRMDGIDTTIADLDDRIVASTYEAGEGIYFGQGEEHTNINVEDELLDEIHQNTQDVADLKDRVDNLEDRVDDVEDDINDIKGDITTIQGDITSIQGDITSIQGDITTIQGDVSDMHTIVNNISNTVTNIQAEIAVHDEDINKLKESAKCNVITVEYAPVGGVWTYEAQDTAATILRYIEEYKANSATAQSDYIDHKDIVVNVSQGPYSYPDMVGIINNYSKPLYIYETSVDYVVCFINNTNWSTGFDNDDYELVSLIVTTGQTPTITFQTYNWNAKLQPLSQAITSMVAQVNGNTAAINSIGNTLTTMQTNITSMQGDITTIQGNITNINSDITNINGDITNINGDITNINGDIATIQGDITQLQSDMTTAQGDITTLQTNTTANILPVTIVSAEAFTLQTSLTSEQIMTMAKDLADNNKPIFVEINNGAIAEYRYKVTDVHFTSNDRRDGDLALLAHYHRPSDQQINTYFIKILFVNNQSPTVETKLTDSFYDMFKIVSNVPGSATIQTPAMVKAIYDEAQATNVDDVDYTKWACQLVIGTRYQWTIPKITKRSNMVYVDVMYIENALNHYYIHAEIASDYSVTYSYMLDTDLKRKKLINEMAFRPMNDSTFDFYNPGIYYEGKYYDTRPEWMPSDVPLNAYHYAIMKVYSTQKNEGVTTGDIYNELEFSDIPGVFYKRVKPSNSATWGSWYKFTGTVVT